VAEHDVVFAAMGSQIRLLIGAAGGEESAAARAAEGEQQFVVDFEAALSRFRPESELCALNADPRPVIPASELMRAAVAAGVEAARRSGGLVDPTLLGEIEAAGYVASRESPVVPLRDALEEAPLGARRAPTPRPPGSGSRSTTRPERSPGRPAPASTRAASARGWRRT
jgi:thiamine biosynthesis lipoprotein